MSSATSKNIKHCALKSRYLNLFYLFIQFVCIFSLFSPWFEVSDSIRASFFTYKWIGCFRFCFSLVCPMVRHPTLNLMRTSASSEWAAWMDFVQTCSKAPIQSCTGLPAYQASSVKYAQVGTKWHVAPFLFSVCSVNYSCLWKQHGPFLCFCRQVIFCGPEQTYKQLFKG